VCGKESAAEGKYSWNAHQLGMGARGTFPAAKKNTAKKRQKKHTAKKTTAFERFVQTRRTNV
jgi:hypothetical protein